MTVIELAEVVFASDLQPRPTPSRTEVAAAVNRVLTSHDLAWCICQVAQEAGDHPDCYLARMRWALAVAGDNLQTAA